MIQIKMDSILKRWLLGANQSQVNQSVQTWQQQSQSSVSLATKSEGPQS